MSKTPQTVGFNDSMTSLQEMLLSDQSKKKSHQKNNTNTNNNNNNNNYDEDFSPEDDKLLEYHLELKQISKPKDQQRRQSGFGKKGGGDDDENSILNLYADKANADKDEEQKIEILVPKKNDRDVMEAISANEDIREAAEFDHALQQFFEKNILGIEEDDEEEDEDDETYDQRQYEDEEEAKNFVQKGSDNDHDNDHEGEQHHHHRQLHIRKSHADRLRERDEHVKLVLDQAIELADEVDAASLILYSAAQDHQKNKKKGSSSSSTTTTVNPYNTRVSSLLKLLYRDIETRQWRFDTEKAIKVKKEQIAEEQRRMREQGRVVGGGSSSPLSALKKNNNNAVDFMSKDGQSGDLDDEANKNRLENGEDGGSIINSMMDGSPLSAASLHSGSPGGSPTMMMGRRRRGRNAMKRRRKRSQKVSSADGPPKNLNIPAELLKQMPKSDDGGNDDNDDATEKRKQDDIFGTLTTKNDNLKELLMTDEDDDEDGDGQEWEYYYDEEAEEEEEQEDERSMMNNTFSRRSRQMQQQQDQDPNNQDASFNSTSNHSNNNSGGMSFNNNASSSLMMSLRRGGGATSSSSPNRQQPRLGRAARQKEEEEKRRREREKGVFTKLYDELEALDKTTAANETTASSNANNANNKKNSVNGAGNVSSPPSSKPPTNPKIEQLMKQFSHKFKSQEDLEKRRSGLPASKNSGQQEPRYARGTSSPNRAVESFTALQEVDSLYRKANKNFEVAKMSPGTRNKSLPYFVVGSEKEEVPRDEYIHHLIEEKRKHQSEAVQFATDDPLSSPQHRGSHIRRLQEMTRAKQMQESRFRRKLEKLQKNMALKGKETSLGGAQESAALLNTSYNSEEDSYNENYHRNNSAHYDHNRDGEDHHGSSRGAEVDENETEFNHQKNPDSQKKKLRSGSSFEDEAGPSQVVLEFRKRKKLAFGRKALTDDDYYQKKNSSYQNATLSSSSKNNNNSSKKKEGSSTSSNNIPKNDLPPLRKKNVVRDLLSDEAKQELDELSEAQKELYFENPFAPTPTPTPSKSHPHDDDDDRDVKGEKTAEKNNDNDNNSNDNDNSDPKIEQLQRAETAHPQELTKAVAEQENNGSRLSRKNSAMTPTPKKTNSFMNNANGSSISKRPSSTSQAQHQAASPAVATGVHHYSSGPIRLSNNTSNNTNILTSSKRTASSSTKKKKFDQKPFDNTMQPAAVSTMKERPRYFEVKKKKM